METHTHAITMPTHKSSLEVKVDALEKKLTTLEAEIQALPEKIMNQIALEVSQTSRGSHVAQE
ncbi:MAG: hypothetical protein FWG38_01625 [Defluviitaleaceae bacterium]|nr:hypothetical protein [Defluviitaleaceae bacterium]